MKTNLRIFTERPHLRNPSLMVLMKLSVDGHFDKSCFEKALQKLKDVHPLLYSSIFINDDGDAFYQENAVQQLELYCAKREYPNQWMEVAESENKKPFNCEKGSLIRFFVFYSDTDFDILAAVHHLLGDGDAIARLLWDVMCLYAGNNLPVQEQTLISNENDFPPKARLSFPAKMLIRSLNTTWNKGTQPRFGEKEFQEMFNQYHQLADIGLSYSTINKSEIDGLHNVCKAHGLTVNTALVTAFIGAMQEEYPDSSDKKLNVGIPINIRKQLSFSPNGCLGSFASAIKIAYKYDSKKDFWQNAVLVNKKIKAKMKSTQAQWLLLNIYARMNPLLIDAMYFAAYGGCNDKAAQKAASMLSIDNASDTAVSNLGRLNFNSQIGAYSIRDWVFFAPKAPGSYAVLGVATFNDTMQIGYSFDRKIISSAMLGNIQSKLLYLLKTSSCQLHE
ncbi:MAG: condensation domain-containing protein [Prevotellaceae bacterium]|nr:condensation domain-containing protein [Prevotellaceae bacterium]